MDIEHASRSELLAELRKRMLPQTVAEMDRKLSTFLPSYVLDMDNEGQLIIYTGLKKDEDGILVFFEPT